MQGSGSKRSCASCTKTTLGRTIELFDRPVRDERCFDCRPDLDKCAVLLLRRILVHASGGQSADVQCSDRAELECWQRSSHALLVQPKAKRESLRCSPTLGRFAVPLHVAFIHAARDRCEHRRSDWYPDRRAQGCTRKHANHIINAHGTCACCRYRDDGCGGCNCAANHDGSSGFDEDAQVEQCYMQPPCI